MAPNQQDSAQCGSCATKPRAGLPTQAPCSIYQRAPRFFCSLKREIQGARHAGRAFNTTKAVKQNTSLTIWSCVHGTWKNNRPGHICRFHSCTEVCGGPPTWKNFPTSLDVPQWSQTKPEWPASALSTLSRASSPSCSVGAREAPCATLAVATHQNYRFLLTNGDGENTPQAR